MPYIKQNQRQMIDDELKVLMNAIAAATPKGPDHKDLPGMLNYIMTQLLQQQIIRNGGPSYSLLNKLTGAVECCKLEFYRRVVAPYEDEKIQENGDIQEGLK